MSAAAETPAQKQLYLLRLAGEIAVKGRGTRLHFLHRLQGNIESALASTGVPYKIERDWSRFVVEAPRGAALEVLPNVFGISSLSAVERRPWDTVDDVIAAGEALFADRVAGKSFAVRARRGGDKRFIPFRSADVDRALGARLRPRAARVDLTNPEVTVQIEIRTGEALFSTDAIPGPGGLPLGTEGRALALVSGGFDSAVAAWSILKRGVRLDYLFCNLGGGAHRDGVLAVMKLVAERWSFGYRPKLHAVDLQPIVERLRSETDPRYWQVVLKRLMLHAANQVARLTRAEALVTGEAVGQVSSQTLRNLRAIDEVAELPVLRPLAAADKEEIVALARKIGTYELSAAVRRVLRAGGQAPGDPRQGRCRARRGGQARPRRDRRGGGGARGDRPQGPRPRHDRRSVARRRVDPRGRRRSSTCARARPSPAGTGPAPSTATTSRRCARRRARRRVRRPTSTAPAAGSSTARWASRAPTSPSCCAPPATRPGTSRAACGRCCDSRRPKTRRSKRCCRPRCSTERSARHCAADRPCAARPFYATLPAREVDRLMANVPQDLRYTEQHEYLKPTGQEGVYFVGITDYAQNELGDIVFVELPAAGMIFAAGQSFGTIEAVKAVSNLYTPLAGEVVTANGALDDNPAAVNADPYGEGWMITLRLADPSQVNGLLTAAQYEQLIAG